MNKNPNPTDRQLLQLILRAQHLARKDAQSDEGYAMMLVSILSILIFSMLGAFLTMTNLNKSSTNAYVDSSNSFYTAESGLNRRANELRQKFIGYATPAGATPGGAVTNPAVNVVNCFAQPIISTANPATANDFECRNFQFNYTKNDSKFQNKSNTNQDFGGSAQITGTSSNVSYIGYTFVADRTVFNPPGSTNVQTTVIPAGNFVGLNSIDYQYTVFATAAKVDPLNPTTTAQGSDARTVLQMNFTSRIVPLFQFAVFYAEDLEMNSTSRMTLSGRVHTNGNLYVQPTGAGNPITIVFNSPVTSGGSIYNNVQSAAYLGLTNYTPPLILQTPPATYFTSSFGNAVSTTPVNVSPFGTMVRDGSVGVQPLTTPDAGFLRKRNYISNKIGEYFGKADLRLEMVPDRDVTSKAAATWTRDTSVIPFNFTSIQTGATGACSQTAPAAGSDPAANYIDPTRQNVGTLNCNVFTKGQLQSLRQPVLVRTDLNQTGGGTLPATEDTTLGKVAALTAFGNPVAPVLSTTANNNAILRALQVALVSTPTPVNYNTLNIPFNAAVYNVDVNTTIPVVSTTAMVDGHLNTFRIAFQNLLIAAGVPTNDQIALLAASPNQIAALRGAWFLPAPVQRIEHNNPAVNIALNPRSSGFYDGRERRWITMLQTNIKSLSVWNRDGIFVEATNQIMANSYAPDPASVTQAFNNGNNSTALVNGATGGLAFVRAPINTTTPSSIFGNPAAAIGLRALGLGASDTTEGGLVFHATVNDRLMGTAPTTALTAANDITTDTFANNTIFRKFPDGVTNYLDGPNGLTGNTIPVDYPRIYPQQPAPTNSNPNPAQSPFGFAFNNGNYLPASMTLVTDQAIYVQGDFNQNGTPQLPAVGGGPDQYRLPAAIMGDTISILSNQCLSGISAANLLNTPRGQIDCGIPGGNLTGGAATGSVNIGGNYTNYPVTGPTAVNAAFLSATRRSCNNVGRAACPGGVGSYSGGLNNYMRMLEDWGGAGAGGNNFNYSGSFVSLGAPLEYSGQYFGGGTYYNIPVRNFNFDLNFNSYGLLPPLSPRAIFLQQDVFKRTYK